MTYLKFAVGAAVAGIAAMLPTTPAQAQEKATECRGQLIENVPFRLKDGQVNRYEGELFGHLRLYYLGDNMFCSVMYHGGPTWDKPLTTGVRFYKYANDGDNEVDDNTVRERGTFRFQAGPINARAFCMQAGGALQYKGAYHVLYTYRYRGTKRLNSCA